ncbi:MAG TPA: transposase [Acetobacteraceae bacterium]|jgi:transposase|nr:transposase [Acetobacteraceae bacterium]
MDSILDEATGLVRRGSGDYRRIEMITGTVRRRHWTAEEKASLVAESFRAGVNVSELARRSGVNRGLLQTWRRRTARSVENAAAAFIPIRVEEPVPSVVSDAEPVVAAPLPSERSSPGRQEKGTIEIEAGGMHVRVRGSVDLEALRTVLAGLERRR